MYVSSKPTQLRATFHIVFADLLFAEQEYLREFLIETTSFTGDLKGHSPRDLLETKVLPRVAILECAVAISAKCLQFVVILVPSDKKSFMPARWEVSLGRAKVRIHFNTAKYSKYGVCQLSESNAQLLQLSVLATPRTGEHKGDPLCSVWQQ